MTAARLLKTIGALLLLISITLPMATCTRTVKSEHSGENNTSPQSEQVQDTASKQEKKIYILDHFSPSDPGSWISIVAFTWPVLILGILWWRKKGRVVLLVRGLEPFLLIGSVLVVDFASTFFADRREIGAYLAFFAIALYAVGAIWRDISLYLRWKNEKNT